jgi:hypothetical protein
MSPALQKRMLTDRQRAALAQLVLHHQGRIRAFLCRFEGDPDQSTNYWVDVVFTSEGSTPPLPPPPPPPPDPPPSHHSGAGGGGQKCGCGSVTGVESYVPLLLTALLLAAGGLRRQEANRRS